MKLFDWREKSWRHRAILLLTVIVVVALASHPELRLFLPLIDALGLDLLVLLISAQAVDFVRPWLLIAYRHFVLPVVAKAFALIIYFLGMAGPYVDARVAAYRLSRNNAT
jgi:hypothetical protein